LLEWLKLNWKSLIFNICETVVIFLLGFTLNLKINYILIIMLLFMVSRGFFGKTIHFKTWYRCLVWSALIMLSLFVFLKIDLPTSILFAIFSAFLMTGKSNINDMYLWYNKTSKYQDVIEYIKNNDTNIDLIEFENKIKTRDEVDYLLYKYKFKECKTFKEINELLDMENPRIVENLDKIAFAIRIYCEI